VALKFFLDTNIVVYAASARDEDDRKRLIALEVLSEGGYATSAQVHQEFYNTVTRKNDPPMDHLEALAWLSDLSRFKVVPITHQIVYEGAEFASRYQLSYWDGAIIAAAHASGAREILSEDLSDGQQYGDVRVINPFPGYTPKELRQ
jgi:predicted nucleic acid-binding protein